MIQRYWSIWNERIDKRQRGVNKNGEEFIIFINKFTQLVKIE